MTTPPNPLPVVRVLVQPNRTRHGRRTAAPARRAATYIAFGGRAQRQQDGRQRGRWLANDGQTCSHEAVLNWAETAARHQAYTFQSVLALPESSQLTPAQYNQALTQAGTLTTWRLMVHTDSQHQHAHLLFFGHQRLDKATFQQWQTAVRHALHQQLQSAPQPQTELEVERETTPANFSQVGL